MKNLELLSMATDYVIQKNEYSEEDCYEVYPPSGDLCATIDDNGNLGYFREGCYNSGTDSIEIDIEELLELKKFVELLEDNEKEAKPHPYHRR